MGKLTQSTPEIQRILNEADGIREFVAETVGNISANAEPMVSVTYYELVNLRNNGELIAGMQYRITDYVTTTVQEYTQSAGHQFDIIVTADNENTLNEVARACLHEGDTYFSNASAKLEAWQIWYSLDNDAERFAWADAENGKGVIYRMIDEFGNDCPYDFKNIKYIRYELEAPDAYEAGGDFYSLWIQGLSENIRERFALEDPSFLWAGIADEEKYWEEEYSELISHTTGNTRTFYTFNGDNGNDLSLSGKIKNNTMSFTRSLTLPNNVFFGECENNSFGSNCLYNSIGKGCNFNSFGNECQGNILGTNSSYNTFGDSCYANILSSFCHRNTFDNNCSNNSLGSGSQRNYFKIGCYSNSLGEECLNNNFGNMCFFNVFGNRCSNNSFGSECQTNCFCGNGVDYIGHFYQYNNLASGVREFRFINSGTASASQSVQFYDVAHGVSDEMIQVVRDCGFETKVGVTRNGVLMTFNLADLA